MLLNLRILTIVICMLFSLTAQAVTVRSSGNAAILNGDIDSARSRALNRAKEQASLQASAQIAMTQSISNGILEIDNLRISTGSRIDHFEIIDEQINNAVLYLTIEAELSAQSGCADQQAATAYQKSIAMLQWSHLRPGETNLGSIQQLVSFLPAYLGEQLDPQPHLRILDVTGMRAPEIGTLGQGGNGRLQLNSQALHTLRAQYLLNGRVRSTAMQRSYSDTRNILSELARSALSGSDELRFFDVEIDLMDGASGALLQRYHLTTQGAWRGLQTQSATLASFRQQPYGQAVLAELDKLARQLSDQLACQPLRGTINRTAGSRIWIDLGSEDGLHPGDRLSVARVVTEYNASMELESTSELTPYRLTLDRVDLNSASGMLDSSSEIANIQAGDLVIGY